MAVGCGASPPSPSICSHITQPSGLARKPAVAGSPCYVRGKPLQTVDPTGLIGEGGVASAIGDATGGCGGDKSFTDNVVDNYVNVLENTRSLKTLAGAAVGGAIASKYGGLTMGAAAKGLVTEFRGPYSVTGVGSRTFV